MPKGNRAGAAATAGDKPHSGAHAPLRRNGAFGAATEKAQGRCLD